ncbi:MAG TPA: VOC family protein [Stellaceae bacterium]|nr:VOC family protein [Stellaceae bacterium]
MRRHITGIDHCFALVRDLDSAKAVYERLGFTLSPRGVHSAHKGTANHTIMFERDYFELLGVVTATPGNAHQRQILAAREGLAAVALRTGDADGAAAEMRAAGVALSDPVGFARPVDLPDGGRAEAAFRTTQFPEGIVPGFHVFCCQHLTPQNTWIPDLMRHANTAIGLASLVTVSQDPAGDAATTARLLATEVITEGPGAVRVETGTVPIRFLAPGRFEAQYAEGNFAGLHPNGLVALVVAVRSRDAAEAALTRQGVPFTRTTVAVIVAPRDACGVSIVFREA